MRVLYDNLAIRSATVVTAGSENADLPASNLKHPHRTKVYRTGASVAAEWLKFDLGSAMAVQAVVLLDHTLTASDTLIKLQGNATDSWGSPSVDETLTYNAGTMKKYLSAAQTYRWWRVIFTKSAAVETRDIGGIFLGPYDEYDRGPAQPDGLSIDPEDASVTDYVPGGQSYSDIRDSRDIITIDFPLILDTQMDLLRALAAACGTHTPFFVDIDPTLKPYDLLYYVKARSVAGRKVKVWGASTANIRWDASMKLSEEL